MSYRIGVTASREWKDPVTIAISLASAVGIAIGSGQAAVTEDITVIVGRARGGDRMAEDIAVRMGCRIEPYPVTAEEWKRSRSAGFDRNSRMVASGADTWLAFIRDHSAGATDCRDKAAAAGMALCEYTETSAVMIDWELCDEIAAMGLDRDYGPPFEALYSGRCPCGGPWEPGDQIAWSADDDQFIHASCVS